ncbi:hypothetical protein BDR07DRAFT_411542 [Suillus spraguei]|nr:hypothetical protein BDR07DRAFT_521400 [Suillus spraguei]KAG2356957.1 hypothetical protein BDR07DRAFT_411542 [Suillus spraguei]
MLQDTSAQVTTLRDRCLASIPVTQAIAGCFVEIDRYLAEYLVVSYSLTKLCITLLLEQWSSQMQSQRDICEILVVLQRERDDRQNISVMIQSFVTRGQSSVEPTASQSVGTATRGCITLIDITGHQHPISVNFCTSFEQFNDMLKALFECNSIEARIQRQCMESGQYDLCIDEGTQVTRLTSNEWPRFEVDAKVVMRILIQQQMSPSSGVSYRCSCGVVNTLGVGPIMYSFERQVSSLIDW